MTLCFTLIVAWPLSKNDWTEIELGPLSDRPKKFDATRAVNAFQCHMAWRAATFSAATKLDHQGAVGVKVLRRGPRLR